MNSTSHLLLALVTIIGLSIIGLPVAYAMIGGSILWLLVSGLDMGTAAEQLLNGMMTSQLLLAIPLFILAAEFMNSGSIMDKLLHFCNAIVGRFRGGLAQVNVLQSVVFASMSGSALADAAASGKLMQTLMTKDGKYPAAFAAALTCVSAVIGPIIPPSIPLVLYALISDTSVWFLFVGGMVPGLLLGAVQSGLVAVVAKRRNFPVEARVPLRELPRITWEAMPALLMPVILLGCLYSGITTPTEAAAVAAAYALLVSALLYRSVSWKDVYHSLVTSARVTVSIGMLIAAALVFNYVITAENIPKALSGGTQSLRSLAADVPDSRQHPAADPGLLSRGNHDHIGDTAGASADRAGARHRHGALRRDVRRQHHDRAGHAALWTAALHDDQDRRHSAARHGARSDAVPLCDDRRAGDYHARARHRAVPAAAPGLQGLK
jgi:tripartite ATP-independent transporter DctM subunit